MPTGAAAQAQSEAVEAVEAVVGQALLSVEHILHQRRLAPPEPI
jgi:hypothetical protein